MTARSCTSCGSLLPADAPGGLCPRCLLAGGLNDSGRTSDYAPFEPPDIAEIAALFPQLEIIELLGAGGMGAVYKARQPQLDRIVALKILPQRDDPAFAERFTREARALAKLSHPGIVTVHDFGQAGGLYYFVMEFVDGVNLRQAERGKLSPAEALAIVPQICAALQFAHDAGVVHRDIKPENILLDAKGRVKIADFGLAKLSGKDGPTPLTHTHQVMGTMHYMAPEQWEKPATVDHRADIYSLGVVFYELLTGELPLGRFPLPSEKVQIDVRLDDIVLRTLEKQPERRYQHASDVKTDVEKISHGSTQASDQAGKVDSPVAATKHPKTGFARYVNMLAMLALMLWPLVMMAVNSVADEGWGHGLLLFGVTAGPLIYMAFSTGWESESDEQPSDGKTDAEKAATSATSTPPMPGSDPLPSKGQLNLLLDETDRSARRLQHFAGFAGLFWIGLGLVIAVKTPGLLPLEIALWAGGVGLLVVAGRIRQQWEVDYLGHIVRFENGVFTSGRLMFDDRVMASGGIGLRTELSARIPSGSGAGDRIIARTEAALLTFRLRLYAETAASSTLAHSAKEMPPSPLAPPNSMQPSFFLRVALPALAMLAIWLAAYWFVRSDVQRVSREYTAAKAIDPNAAIPEDSPFRDVAIAVVQGGSVAGPIIVLVLLLRWMWLTLSRKTFWVVSAAMGLGLPVLGGGLLYVAAMRTGHTMPQEPAIDPNSPRERIIGKWTWADGRVGTTEFRGDGTFEDRYRETVPDVKVGEPIDPEHQKAIERDGKLVGQYSWATHDVIWVKSPGKAPRQFTVVVTENELTLKDNDGGVHRMKRAASPEIKPK